MKTWLTTLLVLGAALVHAQHVTLAWDASPSSGVMNYRIYFGTNAGNYAFVTNSGLVRTQAVVLPHTGCWYFAATAMDTNGVESEFSNEVQWEAKPAPPVVNGEPWLRVVPELYWSTSLSNWSGFKGEATWISATKEKEFFRMGGLRIQRVERVKQP